MLRTAAVDRRVYVRRRFAVALVCGAVLAAFWAAAARADAPHPAGRTIVVQPGDTLWALGERYAPARSDLRRWAAAVERLNHLNGGALTAGQELQLPA